MTTSPCSNWKPGNGFPVGADVFALAGRTSGLVVAGQQRADTNFKGGAILAAEIVYRGHGDSPHVDAEGRLIRIARPLLAVRDSRATAARVHIIPEIADDAARDRGARLVTKHAADPQSPDAGDELFLTRRPAPGNLHLTLIRDHPAHVDFTPHLF
jgi:hypothetical protein